MRQAAAQRLGAQSRTSCPVLPLFPMNKSLLLLAGAIASEVVATSALKACNGLTRAPITALLVAGIALTICGAALLTLRSGSA